MNSPPLNALHTHTRETIDNWNERHSSSREGANKSLI